MSGMRIDSFIAKMRSAESVEDMERITRTEKRYLVKTYKVLSSRRAAYAKYRRAVKNELTRQHLKVVSDRANGFVLGRMLKAKEVKRDAQMVKFRGKNKREISDLGSWIQMHRDLLDPNSRYFKRRQEHNANPENQTRRKLDKQNSYHVMIGLLGLTGRRPVEIGVTAKFERIGANRLMFTGQAKLKGRVTDIRQGYEIPVLHIPGMHGDLTHEVIDALELLRNWPRLKPPPKPVDEMTTAELVEYSDVYHNRVSKPLGQTGKVVFGESYYPYLARYAYAEAIIRMFPRLEEDAFYRSELLGHGSDDIGTGVRYSRVAITDPLIVQRH